MKFRTALVKTLSFLLCLMMLVGVLSSCGQAKEISAKRVVGTVDGTEIYYDEVYMLANRYLETAKKAAGNDSAKVEEELDSLVRDNLRLHVAMIRQGEKLGLEYQPEDFEDSVNQELELLIAENFAGDEALYRESLKENALTERYIRYTTSVDLFYEQLLVEYPKQGLVASDTESVRKYVEENFVRIYHLAFFFDESNRDEKLAKITEAKELLLGGSSMYDLIKKGYTEDFLNPSGTGYYIVPGSMDELYEEAAFALKIGEVSEIVEAKGYDNQNQYSSCFYLLQRFELDETYVDENLNELQSQYYDSVIYNDLQEIRKELSFEPNSFYESLTLTELLPAREGMSTGGIVLIVGGVVLLMGGAIVVAVVLIRKKPAKAKSKKAKKKSAPRLTFGGER